ncbi:MAG: hypothetical protein ACREOH_21065, partial [Candidatus Entotheonellia bacterium]
VIWSDPRSPPPCVAHGKRGPHGRHPDPAQRLSSSRWARDKRDEAKFYSDPNGIKVRSNTLLYQGVTCYSTRFHEERVRLGPALDGAVFDAVRAVGIDHQRG